MRANLKVIALCALVASSNAYSYTQCARTVSSVWVNLSSGANINVTFTDGGGSITKSESQLSEEQMARFFSMVLTAKSSGKMLQIRYPEDGLVCPPPPSASARNDVHGVWLVD